LSSIHVTDQHEIKFEFLFFRLFVALFVLNLREPELRSPFPPEGDYHEAEIIMGTKFLEVDFILLKHE
jgi:hypothetical protein